MGLCFYSIEARTVVGGGTSVRAVLCPGQNMCGDELVGIVGNMHMFSYLSSRRGILLSVSVGWDVQA